MRQLVLVFHEHLLSAIDNLPERLMVIITSSAVNLNPRGIVSTNAIISGNHR
jgi:hypothetical protein